MPSKMSSSLSSPPQTVDLEEKAAEAASLLRALSNERRLLILCHLVGAQEVSVGRLVQIVGLSQSALSQHLALLRREGLVATRRAGTVIHYRIVDPRAAAVLRLLYELYCEQAVVDAPPP